MEKPSTPKCVQEKTKIDLFRDFLQKPPMSKLRILFQLKFPQCINSFGLFKFCLCLLPFLVIMLLILYEIHQHHDLK
jgi:hypothetical protein